MIKQKTAFKLGLAYSLGFHFVRQSKLAYDAAKWITVHPNGKGVNLQGGDIKGRPLLIDGESGQILGGIGGKFTGKKLSDFKRKKSPNANTQTNESPQTKSDKSNNTQATKTPEDSKKAAWQQRREAVETVPIPDGWYRSTFAGETIKRETEKAVLVYALLGQPTGIDNNGKSTYYADVWLPKSQVVITNGAVAAISPWAAYNKAFDLGQGKHVLWQQEASPELQKTIEAKKSYKRLLIKSLSPEDKKLRRRWIKRLSGIPFDKLSDTEKDIAKQYYLYIKYPDNLEQAIKELKAKK